MTDFLNSLKADLLDRRLLPLVAVVVVALVAAIGYAVFGGGSNASTTTASVSSGPVVAARGLAISQSTHEQAVAETTNGVADQHRGKARNPFTPLVSPKTTTATAASTTSSSGSSSSSSSGASSQGSGGSAPSAPAKPSTPAKPKTIYHVAVLFGVIPAGTTPQTAQLTPYENLKLLTPLPSTQSLVVFRGVTAGGKSATFTLVGEAILHGNGACLPSASQCQALDLKPGQAEQLEYLPPTGVPVLYELRVVSIASDTASGARVRSVLRGESKVGRALLDRTGLVSLPFLRYSSQPGVLVFPAHSAVTARAHAAGHPRHRR
jgi:hypothetical protein